MFTPNRKNLFLHFTVIYIKTTRKRRRTKDFLLLFSEFRWFGYVFTNLHSHQYQFKHWKSSALESGGKKGCAYFKIEFHTSENRSKFQNESLRIIDLFSSNSNSLVKETTLGINAVKKPWYQIYSYILPLHAWPSDIKIIQGRLLLMLVGINGLCPQSKILSDLLIVPIIGKNLVKSIKDRFEWGSRPEMPFSSSIFSTISSSKRDLCILFIIPYIFLIRIS